MASFQDVLNKPMDEIKAPQALPVGTYLCIVDGQPEITQKGKNNNYCAIFNLKTMQAQPDVNQEALAQVLNGSALTDRKLKHTLWITDDAAWRLKQFLVDHLGITASNPNEAIPMAAGRQVLVTVGHRASDDGTQIFADIKGTAKV